MSFKKVWQSLQESDGAMYNISTGELNPNKGSFAAHRDKQMIVGIPTTFEEFKAEIRTYFKVQADNFVEPETYLGLWVNDGKLYINVLKHFIKK